MLNSSPQYMNDLIMSNVRRQHGPAVTDPSALAAAHNASQAQRRDYVENAGQRLAFSKQAHDRAMGLQKRHDKFANTQGNIATGLSAIGLGVSAYGDHKAQKQEDERGAAFDKIIGNLKASGNDDGAYFATMLDLIRKRG
jgi:hypothetical protein